jgi:hypothetical protein
MSFRLIGGLQIEPKTRDFGASIDAFYNMLLERSRFFFEDYFNVVFVVYMQLLCVWLCEAG